MKLSTAVATVCISSAVLVSSRVIPVDKTTVLNKPIHGITVPTSNKVPVDKTTILRKRVNKPAHITFPNTRPTGKITTQLAHHVGLQRALDSDEELYLALRDLAYRHSLRELEAELAAREYDDLEGELVARVYDDLDARGWFTIAKDIFKVGEHIVKDISGGSSSNKKSSSSQSKSKGKRDLGDDLVSREYDGFELAARGYDDFAKELVSRVYDDLDARGWFTIAKDIFKVGEHAVKDLTGGGSSSSNSNSNSKSKGKRDLDDDPTAREYDEFEVFERDVDYEMEIREFDEELDARDLEVDELD